MVLEHIWDGQTDRKCVLANIHKSPEKLAGTGSLESESWHLAPMEKHRLNKTVHISQETQKELVILALLRTWTHRLSCHPCLSKLAHKTAKIWPYESQAHLG